MSKSPASTRRTARPVEKDEGRVTKIKGEAASVAPEGQTVEQPPEVAATIPESAAETIGSETAPAEAPAAEIVAPSDIFADLPMVEYGEYSYRDLTEVLAESDPRKYEAVHRAAKEQKLPVKKDWKHATAMITWGSHSKEFKPTSVYGTIDRIVRNEGRAGIPAAVLVAKVRQEQIGNKRSHFCTALPPIGWAEGWIDTYISKNHGKVMAKVAPPLTAEVIAEIKQGDAEAEAKAEVLSHAA